MSTDRLLGLITGLCLVAGAAVAAPVITSINPSQWTQGGAAFTLEVNGSGFVPESKMMIPSRVRWNGSYLSTTYVSATRLTASVTSSYLATAGTFNIDVRNPDATVSNAVPFTVNPPPTITTTSLRNGEVGKPYNEGLYTGGTGTWPLTWSLPQGALPYGLTLLASGVITGTPKATGSFSFTVMVTDAAQTSASKQFAITIYTPLAITTTALPSGAVGVPYSLTLAATGGLPPYTSWGWVSTNYYQTLPPGLSLNTSTGVISGVPTQTGSWGITIEVHDSAGLWDAKSFGLTIGGLTITTPSPLPNGAACMVYAQTFAATGGTPPYRWAISGGAPPAGLAMSSSGVLSGTPSTSGTFNFTVQVTDSAASPATGSKAFSLTVSPSDLVITTSSPLPNGRVNTAYYRTLAAAGGTTPYSWTQTSGTLPAGVTLSSSGAVGGTPTQSGQFNFTVEVRSAGGGCATSKAFSLYIEGVGPPQITTPSPLPNGAVCAAYSFTMTATGGVPPLGWGFASADRPPGLALSPAGVLSGTPTATGTYSFPIQVIDSQKQYDTKTFGLTVYPSELVIATGSPLPSGTVNIGYSVTLAGAGGTPPYNWVHTGGALPPGLTLRGDGVLGGTPVEAGTYAFTVELRTGIAGCGTSKDFTLVIERVAQPLRITTTSPLPNGSTCQVYSQTLAATGGTPPYRWAVTAGALPSGVSLDPASGALAGTPSATGAFSFTVQVTDSAASPATDSRAFTLTIAADLTITTGTLPNGKVNTPYSVSLAATGGATPYTWSLASGTLPGGLALSSAGVLSGTPTTAGASSFTVEVRSAAGGCTGRKGLSLTIDPVSGLTITTTSPLPAATVRVAYGQTLSATGGVTPYTWSATGLPAWLSLDTGTGLLSGIPSSAGASNFSIRVTDRAQNTATKAFSITVNPGVAALTITTASPLTQGRVGVAYSTALAATGGTAPYGWSSTGSLPGGLALSPAGVLSGVPTAAGTFNFTAQVTDADKRSAAKAFTLVVSTIPAVTLAGLPAIPAPLDQPKLSLTLATAYPVAITGRVTLAFAPNVVNPAASYPAVQFATGGQSVNFTIPANQTRGTFPAAGAAVSEVAVQVGSVAGTITLRASFAVGGQDVTPPTPPSRDIRIDRLPPSLTADSVRVVRTGSGFEVHLTGFSTPRQVTQAIFQFTPGANSDLRTRELTVDVGKAFSDWYAKQESAAFGSAFQYIQPFEISGDANAVTAVSVTLKNDSGSSQTVPRSF